MDKDDIIRMARVAGCHDNGEEFRFVEFRYLERFAALVAAAEREACAKVCEDMGRGHGSAFAEFDCAAAIRARGEK